MDSCPLCREEYSNFNNIEQIKSEYEILESKCKKLREDNQSIIKKMTKERVINRRKRYTK